LEHHVIAHARHGFRARAAAALVGIEASIAAATAVIRSGVTMRDGGLGGGGGEESSVGPTLLDDKSRETVWAAIETFHLQPFTLL